MAMSRLTGLLVALAFSLTACGGGGGGGSGGGDSNSGGGSGSSGPTWTPGVYQAASLFKDLCETVRTGVDVTNEPYPDMPGSTLEENFWLRSWTHETYLWNNEVLDRNPADYSDNLAYFALLRTTATTPSGADKDQFHFSIPTDEYLAEVTSAGVASYGAEFAVLEGAPPREIVVAFTEAGTPAAELQNGTPKLARGVRILEVDGVDAVNGGTQADVDAILDGLFPLNSGETHTFRVQAPGEAARTITLVSQDLAPAAVNRYATIAAQGGSVGYVLLNTFGSFSAEEELAQAIAALEGSGVTDLVLDLRYNGGGFLAIASQLSYMIAGASRTNGKVFEALRFNADAGNLNPVTGAVNQPTPFYATGLGFSLNEGVPLPSLDLSRVYVLSTDLTCSASESVINSLRGIGVEVVLIGGTTCGKPYGFYATDNCGDTYFSIQFQGVNDADFGDYADGFVPNNSSAQFGVRIPGCQVSDDFNNELGDVDEALLSAALQYRRSGSCPVIATRQSQVRAATGGAELHERPASPLDEFLSSNRDMRMPN